VLVLSEFAGAAKELDAAVLVNPHDIDGMAQKISMALAMPLGERQERWRAMVSILRSASVQAWFSDFVSALAEGRRAPVPAAAAMRNVLAAPLSRSAAQAGA
jgi:trehalose 6-phosphate synthase